MSNNRKITHISLMLTEDCNFKCEYCFIKKNPQRITWGIAKQAIDWLVNENKDSKEKMNINFFGGEPTLEWDMIEKIVAYGKNKSDRLTYGMTTNGSLLTKERMDYCERNNIGILFSVDGPEHVQNIHRKTRSGEGTFDKIENNMRECVKRGLSPTGRVTYTPDTLPYLFETVKYLFEDIGFKDVAPTPAVDSFKEFSAEDYKEYDRQFTMIDEYFKDMIIAGKKPSLNYYGKCVRQIVRDEKMIGPCGAGKGYVGISIEGGLYPCHRFTQWPEWKIGDVWSGITEKAMRDSLTNYNCNTNSKKCRECDNMFCGGTCLAASYNNTGSIHMPGKDACKLSMLQFKRAEKLLHEMKDFPQFREMFSQYIKQDRTGIFEKQIQDVYSNSKDTPTTQTNNSIKKPSLALINNRVNVLEVKLNEANKKLDDIRSLVGALSNVVMDLVEGGDSR